MKKAAVLLVISLLALVSCQSTNDDVGAYTASTVSVSGSGTVSLRPDMASFTVSIEKTADTTIEAHRQASATMEEVYAILFSGFGVEEGDITTNSISFNPVYRYENGQQLLVGQKAYQSITVTVYDLASLAFIVDELSAVSGISLSSITLDAKSKEAAEETARILAVQDALSRAEDYASALGLSVSALLSLSEGSTSYTGVRLQANTLLADSASQYYAGDLSVSANVSASFALER